MERTRTGHNKLKKFIAVGLAGAALSACATPREVVAWQPTIVPATADAAPQTYRVVPSAQEIENRLESAWQAVAARHQSDVDIAVYDRTDGVLARYTNTDETFNTASIVKFSILAATLLHNQEQGQPTLSNDQLQNATPMIAYSDNGAATRLWSQAGGPTGMQEFFDRVHMDDTTASGSWGLTQTTALDQVRVLNTVAYPGAVLTQESADIANELLDQVVPEQHWGVSGGVPEGVTVELKNGWLPNTECSINSIGHVSGNGLDYTIAVLTNDSASMQAGIDTIEDLAAATWRELSDIDSGR